MITGTSALNRAPSLRPSGIDATDFAGNTIAAWFGTVAPQPIHSVSITPRTATDGGVVALVDGRFGYSLSLPTRSARHDATNSLHDFDWASFRGVRNSGTDGFMYAYYWEGGVRLKKFTIWVTNKVKTQEERIWWSVHHRVSGPQKYIVVGALGGLGGNQAAANNNDDRQL